MDRPGFSRRTILATTLATTLAGLSAPLGTAARADWPDLVDDRWLRRDDTSDAIVNHEAWTRFLHRHVHVPGDGIARVRYGEVTGQDCGRLQAYIEVLAGTDVGALSPDEQRAYWINLYNALTVDLILQHYPVASIRDITNGFMSFGPWGMDVVTIDGEDLSLDDIEHGILRAIWKDPRIHYVVNCASIGCPNLADAAYVGPAVDRMMSRAAAIYVNHPRGAGLDLKGRLVVSSLYDWYDDDFGENEAAIVDHIRGYAAEPLIDRMAGIDEIEGYAYDWALNDATGMDATGM
ncbi:MAG: DUF547 domain-containing protein [Rhodospirillales bacterium]|nr:DUF547 domain-containing protein [Rhodospirillales bacterium]